MYLCRVVLLKILQEALTHISNCPQTLVLQIFFCVGILILDKVDKLVGEFSDRYKN